MADRFALIESSPAHGEGAGLASGDTGPSAIGARQLGAEGVGWSFEKDFEGSRVKAGGGGLRDLFHGIEIEVESRAIIAAGPSGDDFSPLGSQFVEFLKLRRGKGTSRHDGSGLGVRTQTAVKILPSM